MKLLAEFVKICREIQRLHEEPLVARENKKHGFYIKNSGTFTTETSIFQTPVQIYKFRTVSINIYTAS